MVQQDPIVRQCAFLKRQKDVCWQREQLSIFMDYALAVKKGNTVLIQSYQLGRCTRRQIALCVLLLALCILLLCRKKIIFLQGLQRRAFKKCDC
jgi:hypothetical protein